MQNERGEVLVHITYGQPTRGTELLASTIVNNSMGGIRSVFWVYGRLMLTQYYNKSRNVHGDKYLSRHLPKDVSRLVVLYLAVVRPFERYAIGVLNAHNASERNRKQSNYHLYLFVRHGEVMTSNQLTLSMASHTLKVMGVELHLSSYRHIAIAFFSTRIQAYINQQHMLNSGKYDVPASMLRGRALATEDESSLLHNEQAAHTAAVGNRVYAFSSLDFSYVDKQNLNNFFMVSLSWQKLLGYELCEADVIALKQQKPAPIDLTPVAMDIACIPEPKRRRLDPEPVKISHLLALREFFGGMTYKSKTSTIFEKVIMYSSLKHDFSVIKKFGRNNDDFHPYLLRRITSGMNSLFDRQLRDIRKNNLSHTARVEARFGLSPGDFDDEGQLVANLPLADALKDYLKNWMSADNVDSPMIRVNSSHYTTFIHNHISFFRLICTVFKDRKDPEALTATLLLSYLLSSIFHEPPQSFKTSYKTSATTTPVRQYIAAYKCNHNKLIPFLPNVFRIDSDVGFFFS